MKSRAGAALCAFAFAFAAWTAVGVARAGEVRKGTSPTVAAYFERAKANRATLVAFLHKMPKGGDLHNHPLGAVSTESIVARAVDKGLYYDRENKTLTRTKPTGPHYAPDELNEVYWKTGEVLEGLSMRNLEKGEDSGHDHFFRAFDRYAAAYAEDLPIYREMFRRAVSQEISYLELMSVAPRDKQWAARVEKIRREVLDEFATLGVHRDLTVRIIMPLLRLLPPELFAETVRATFDTAEFFPDLVVGITILAPEDDPTSQKYFREHMAIIDAEVRKRCEAFRLDPENTRPPPALALHAGELTLEYAAYESMRDRISHTLKTGHASRIGHGTSVMWEDDVYGLLKSMRDCRTAVEICPTSSEGILKVSGGAAHPFRLYWDAGVPVVIATDDEGISRTNLTLEFAKIAEWFDLSYGEIKWLAHSSLEYAFIPGESLFQEGDFNAPRADARAVAAGSRKAALQQRLMDDFAAFERKMEGTIAEFGW